MIAQLNLPTDRIIQIGGSDALLRSLLRKAAAFVYPSIYEGFGFPPLEAMAEGCPVISSRTSSMPEVIGDAAEFFDPNDIDSIAAAIAAVVGSPIRQTELREKGKRRLACFSWAKCARETAEVYQGLL